MGNTVYEKGTYVILHTNDAWNDLHGIVDDLLGDTIAVFCITNPMHRYFVSVNEAARKLEPVSSYAPPMPAIL